MKNKKLALEASCNTTPGLKPRQEIASLAVKGNTSTDHPTVSISPKTHLPLSVSTHWSYAKERSPGLNKLMERLLKPKEAKPQ